METIFFYSILNKLDNTEKFFIAENKSSESAEKEREREKLVEISINQSYQEDSLLSLNLVLAMNVILTEH